MKEKPYCLFFKALANANRTAILMSLGKTRMTVGKICEKTGLEQTAVSHELKTLYSCGMVHCERKGKTKVYWADMETFGPLMLLADAHLSRHMKRLLECGIMKM